MSTEVSYCCDFFFSPPPRKRLHFSHSSSYAPQPKTCIYIIMWPLLLHLVCLCAIYTLLYSTSSPERSYVQRRLVAVSVKKKKKTCPTHLQMTFTQHSNAWRQQNPFWKLNYSTLHNMSVGIKFAQVLVAYRSQLLTVTRDDEVCFDAERLVRLPYRKNQVCRERQHFIPLVCPALSRHHLYVLEIVGSNPNDNTAIRRLEDH